MALQTQIEAVETAIAHAETVMTTSGGRSAAASRGKTQRLRESHEALTHEVEELYADLDVGESFPDLRQYGIEVARVLVMAMRLA